MSKRKTDLLASGEYVSVDCRSSEVVHRARLLVVETSKVVCPSFLTTLSEDVYPVYEQLLAEGHDFKSLFFGDSPFERLKEQSSKRGLGNGQRLTKPWKDLLAGGRLVTALYKWAVDFDALCPWLLDDALRTLYDWRVNPQGRKSLHWHQQHGSRSRPLQVDTFTFECPGWSPLHVAWPAYKAWLEARLQESISLYEQKMRKHAESAGLVPVRRNYSPDNFEWFVLKQFCGMTSTQIAKRPQSHNSDAPTILKGIKTVRTMIGWEQLPSGS